MPRIIETTVYKYSELSDDAKAKARDWYREATTGDNYFAEHITEDFHSVLKALGFDPFEYSGRYLAANDPRARRSTVTWSGFWSQGDGAAFGGTWRAADCDPAALLADRPVAYMEGDREKACEPNAELHRIAARILECKRDGLEFFRIDSSQRSFYMTMDSAEHTQPDEFADDAAEEAYTDACAENEDKFIEAIRDLAHWFYKALEAEYEYQNSDEQVAETIEINEYEFTADGRRA